MGVPNGFQYESNCENSASGTVWRRVALSPKQRVASSILVSRSKLKKPLHFCKGFFSLISVVLWMLRRCELTVL